MLPPTPPLCLCPSFSLFWNLLPPTLPLSLYPSFSLFWNPLIYFCEQASLQIPPLTLQPTLTSHSLHLNKEQPSWPPCWPHLSNGAKHGYTTFHLCDLVHSFQQPKGNYCSSCFFSLKKWKSRLREVKQLATITHLASGRTPTSQQAHTSPETNIPTVFSWTSYYWYLLMGSERGIQI